MIVNIDESVYSMTKKQFDGVLKVASKEIPFGIYAISKRNIAILLREKYLTKEELKKSVAEYASHGFKVYYNI